MPLQMWVPIADLAQLPLDIQQHYVVDSQAVVQSAIQLLIYLPDQEPEPTRRIRLVFPAVCDDWSIQDHKWVLNRTQTRPWL